MKTDSSEQVLLKGFVKNDSKAVETIYKNNFKMVHAFIINNSGTYDDARDIFQEAMITLYEKAKSESFVLSCQIKTYLYSVCRRLWLKRLQQMRRYVSQSEGIQETVAVEEDIDLYEKRNAEFVIMDKSMKSLGEPCKSLLEAFYVDKKGMNEIASKFGYTNADNAKTQKYKCLMRLKKLFFIQYNIGE